MGNIVDKIQFHLRNRTLSNVLKNLGKKPFTAFKKRYPGAGRDLYNKIRYGASAPRFQERIWVDPGDIEFFVPRSEIRRITGLSRSEASGRVIDWDEIEVLKPVRDEYRIRFCLKHWSDGASWEELGIYEYKLEKTDKYKDYTRDQIVSVYRDLDRAYDEIKKEGRLKTRQEIDPDNFRERGGVMIHIGRDGKPCFAGLGFHRLAISFALGLKQIPACIGVVDRHAVKYLRRYRRRDQGTGSKTNS